MSKIRRIALTLAASAGLIALSAEPALALAGTNHCHPVH
jgi:hypothetical protein